MQRNPHSYQIATGYRTFYSLSLIYQPITKKRLFFTEKSLPLKVLVKLIAHFHLNVFQYPGHYFFNVFVHSQSKLNFNCTVSSGKSFLGSADALSIL